VFGLEHAKEYAAEGGCAPQLKMKSPARAGLLPFLYAHHAHPFKSFDISIRPKVLIRVHPRKHFQAALHFLCYRKTIAAESFS
jgi:hypothetical protein